MPMKNDMNELPSYFDHHQFLNIAGLCSLPNFRVERRDAELWAMRDCKFLIFDTDSKMKGKAAIHSKGRSAVPHDQACNSSQPENSVEDKVKKLDDLTWEKVESMKDASMQFFFNLMPNYGPLSSSIHNPSTDPVSDSNHYPCPKCSERTDFKCLVCAECPEFPHDRKTHNFRLFRPRDEFPELFETKIPLACDMCTHFLAVSYCWPPRLDDQNNVVDTPRTYRVRDLDGTVRPNRALDDVLDRAVDVANSFGLRMIWIDQECLPQPPQDTSSPDKEDKELGIQAMDIIYNRAFVTGGLQDVVISNQQQLDTILGLASKRGRGVGITSSRELGIVVDFLNKVERDRWYTRAWVIQEAISAGDNLCLVFRCGPSISIQSKPRMPVLRRGLPKHSLESTPRSRPSEVICMMVDEFRYIYQAAKKFLQQNSFDSARYLIFGDETTRATKRTIAIAEAMHPVFWKPKHKNFAFGAIGVTRFGIRPTVDAAGALTLLKTRGCFQIEDFIAIMANMCGYERRLNPKAVAEECDSLRVALLALSIMNGDYSLLVPEAYSDSLAADGTHNQMFRLLQGFRPGWVHPFDVDIQFVQQVSIRGFDVPRLLAKDCRPGILGFPAYLWEVAYHPIDMTPVKLEWQQDWASINCIMTEFEQQNGESDRAYQIRENVISERQKQKRQSMKEELIAYGFIRNDSSFWHGIEYYAGTAKFSLVLFADHLEMSLESQKIFSKIFFGILRFLFDHANIDPRTQGIANSIWQSMRVDVVQTNHPELPDTVCEDLFQHPTIQQTPFKAILLDRTRYGQYHQVWLFDRIMRHGNLYVGHYIPELGSCQSSLSLESGPEMPVENGSLSDEEPLEWSEKPLSSKLRKGSIMDRQFLRLVQMHIYATDNINNYCEGKMESEQEAGIHSPHYQPTTGEMISFRDHSARKLVGDIESHRAKEAFSVFDVEGPCTIAIPYDAAWERIPHPSFRGMSVCWVIERKPRQCDSTTTEASSSTSSRQPIPSKMSSSCSIRVLDKVKGVWPIMDLPPLNKYNLEI